MPNKGVRISPFDADGNQIRVPFEQFTKFFVTAGAVLKGDLKSFAVEAGSVLMAEDGTEYYLDPGDKMDQLLAIAMENFPEDIAGSLLCRYHALADISKILGFVREDRSVSLSPKIFLIATQAPLAKDKPVFEFSPFYKAIVFNEPHEYFFDEEGSPRFNFDEVDLMANLPDDVEFTAEGGVRISLQRIGEIKDMDPESKEDLRAQVQRQYDAMTKVTAAG